MLLILEKEIAMKLTSGPSPAFPATVELSTHHLPLGCAALGLPAKISNHGDMEQPATLRRVSNLMVDVCI